MRIIFQKLVIDNFLSHKHSEINLSEVGYLQVEGKNLCKNDNAKSNGAGKSAIFDALSWCLTGETTRGTSKDIGNNLINDGPATELLFSIDGNSYKIIRARDNSKYGTTLKFFVNDKDKSGKGLRGTEDIIKQYLPDLDGTLLGSVIVLGQGLPHKFSDNTPSGRKELLEKLSKSDFMIIDIKDKIALRKDILNNKIREVEDNLLVLGANIKTTKNSLEQDRQTLNNFPASTYLKHTLLQKQEELKQCEDKIEEETKKLDRHLEKEKKLINEKADLQTSQAACLAAIDRKYAEKINELTIEKLQCENNRVLKQQELDKLRDIKDICPTCGQKLPNVIKPDTSKLEEEIAILDKKHFEVVDKLHILNNDKAKEKQKQNETFQLAVNDATARNSQNARFIAEERDNLYNLTEEKKALQLNLNDIQLKLQIAESEIERLKNNIHMYEAAAKKLQEEADEKQSNLNNLKEHLSIVNKFYTLATRDFRGILLKTIIDFIDKKCKEYSKLIFDTELLSVEQNKNDILISYNGKSFENLSGGEKQKIDLILQFAIRDMLCSYLNFSSNILVVDECFDNLDAVGCQKVLELISTKLSDIEAIYIISHHSDDLNIPYDNKILVIKDQTGISSIM